MFRSALPLVVLATLGLGSSAHRPAPLAWPHRATVTALHDRPVAFRAYTRGGTLIIAIDSSGRRTTEPALVPTLRALTASDTIHAETPADFPLDLSKGPVEFIADGKDSLDVFVGRNPYGRIDRIWARGHRLIVRLVGNNLMIDSR